MKNNLFSLNGYRSCSRFLNKKTMLLGLFLFSAMAFSQGKKDNQAASDESLLNQYVKSKGEAIILFDASNIKQFWIDKSVASRNQAISILLGAKTQANESVPLRIQLANVRETQDCRIDVISENSDFGFSVLDNQLKTLSSSKKEESFLNYSIASSVFHLEDASGNVFNLVFNSKSSDSISIKKIILSFSENKASSFLSSPGEIKYTSATIESSPSFKLVESTDSSFSVTGKRSVINSSKKIYANDNTFSSSVKIKNVGDTPTTVYVGYAAYTKDKTKLFASNYPYKNIGKTLNVVSAASGSNKLIVDSYSNWEKGCFLALNAKDDLSDIPNTTLLEGKITEFKQLDNGQGEITLDKPLKTAIEKGTKVRVHGLTGSLLYMNIIRALKSGEEQVLTSTIKKDEQFLQYSTKAFSRGVYYVVPFIFSYSDDATKDNTIQISDYSISY